MNKFNLKRHARLIFTSLSVLGTFGGCALGVWVGVRTERARIAHKEETLTKTDWFKLMWKEYVALTLTAILASGCAIASHTISTRDIARLATLATGGGAAFSKYREKVRELLGEEKEKELYKEVQTKNDMIVYPKIPIDEKVFNDNSVHYRIAFDGTDFYSNPEKVAAAMYHLNRQFALTCMVTMHDLKNYLLLEDDGFNRDDEAYMWIDVFFYNNGMSPWIDIHETYTEEDGETIHLLNFEWEPYTEEQLEKMDCI